MFKRVLFRALRPYSCSWLEDISPPLLWVVFLKPLEWSCDSVICTSCDFLIWKRFQCTVWYNLHRSTLLQSIENGCTYNLVENRENLVDIGKSILRTMRNKTNSSERKYFSLRMLLVFRSATYKLFRLSPLQVHQWRTLVHSEGELTLTT